MTSAGIVSEFNPFHNGHKYLIDSVRNELRPDAVVCVMSGDLVQRGEMAVCDKWSRARAAAAEGADLVLELPAVYAVNGAGEFAKGAVRIFEGLGISDLCFGSESGDTARLERAAEVFSGENEAFRESIKQALAAGCSYPSAYQEAAELSGDPELAELLKGPNDILAIEYIKQNRLQNAGMRVHAVKRTGPAHDSMDTDAGSFASASYIRKLIKSSQPAARYMPESMAEALASTKTADAESERIFYELVRYRLLSSDVSDILSVGEGLENRLKKALNEAYDTDSLILAAKTKRYTYARLSRILVQALLGITKEAYTEIERRKLRYARVLALNSRGAAFLNEVKKQGRAIPIISNVNSVAEDAPERLLLDFDIKAADLYSVLTGRPIAPNSDHVITPVMTPGSQPG